MRNGLRKLGVGGAPRKRVRRVAGGGAPRSRWGCAAWPVGVRRVAGAQDVVLKVLDKLVSTLKSTTTRTLYYIHACRDGLGGSRRALGGGESSEHAKTGLLRTE